MIRSIRDYDNIGSQGQQPVAAGYNPGTSDPIGNPYGPLKDSLAPGFRRKSFIFVITVIQIVVFVVMLAIAQWNYGGAFVKCNEMGGPAGAVMYLFGAKWLPAIQRGEVFRFVTPAFLHGGILHIFMNLVFQQMLCYKFETDWGTQRTIVMYFLTAFGATLLACTASPNSLSVGASGALFGMLGVASSYLFLNWRDMPPQERIQRVCNLTCIILFNFIIAIGWNESNTGQGTIDIYAHLGGLISGVCLGLAFGKSISQPARPAYGTALNVRRLGILTTLIYFSANLACSFFAVNSRFDNVNPLDWTSC